jgi:hypothetical protein
VSSTPAKITLLPRRKGKSYIIVGQMDLSALCLPFVDTCKLPSYLKARLSVARHEAANSGSARSTESREATQRPCGSGAAHAATALAAGNDGHSRASGHGTDGRSTPDQSEGENDH